MRLMSKPNVLMLLHNKIGKGTYWRAWGFGRELALRGFDITLVAAAKTRHGIKQYVAEGVNVVEIPELLGGFGYDLWGTFQRLRWLRGHAFDLIHSFETRPVNIGPALYLRKRAGAPLVFDWCDWFGIGGSVEERPNPLIRAILRPFETFFEQSFRTRADATTVINSILKQKAIDLGVEGDRIILLPNGANVDREPQDRGQARRTLGLPMRVPIVVHTGSIFRKDAKLLSDTMDIVHHTLPDALLLLVGYCNVAVEKMVRNPGAVIRTGPIDYGALVDYVTAGDIGLLPLRNSGANRGRFPMKLHDFMSAGRAVVVTDVGDLAETVRRRSAGMVADDTPSSLAETVITLLTNVTARNEMAQRARQFAEEELTWPIVTNKLEHLYRQLLNQPGKSDNAGRRDLHSPVSGSNSGN